MPNKRTGPDYLDKKKEKPKVHHRSSPGPDKRNYREKAGYSQDEWNKMDPKKRKQTVDLLKKYGG